MAPLESVISYHYIGLFIHIHKHTYLPNLYSFPVSHKVDSGMCTIKPTTKTEYKNQFKQLYN